MIRIGWIGCGAHASEMLLPQLVRLPVRLTALCDMDAERLRAVADRYGVAARYADASALIAHIAVSDGPAASSWAASTSVLWALSYFFWSTGAACGSNPNFLPKSRYARPKSALP